MSLGLIIPITIGGAIGIISTFAPNVSDAVDDFSAWEADDFTKVFETYSAGPVLTLIISIGMLLAGVSYMVRNSSARERFRRSERISIGVGLLVVGVIQLINCGATYNAYDQAAKEAGVYVEIGIGYSMSVIAGVVALVLGIVTLSVKAMIRDGRGA